MQTVADLKLKTKSELLASDEKSLKEELVRISKELFVLVMKLNLREQKQTHVLKFARRYIATIKTVGAQKGFYL